MIETARQQLIEALRRTDPADHFDLMFTACTESGGTLTTEPPFIEVDLFDVRGFGETPTDAIGAWLRNARLAEASPTDSAYPNHTTEIAALTSSPEVQQ